MQWILPLAVATQIWICYSDDSRTVQDWPCNEDRPPPFERSAPESRSVSDRPTEQPTPSASNQHTPSPSNQLADLDIEQYCRERRQRSGSYRMEQHCLEREREALSNLQGQRIRPEILEYCNERGRRSGSYRMLEHCVERESEAARQIGR